jgi:effector-binding domain-containing protein
MGDIEIARIMAKIVAPEREMPNSTEPKIEERSEQPYLAIRAEVGMDEISSQLPPLFPEVEEYMAKIGVQPVGPPFFRYLIVDMRRKLMVDVAWPTASKVAGEGPVISDVLPAGRYAIVHHHGDPNELREVTGNLLEWAKANGQEWKMDGERFASRVEWYHSDPAVEPDMSKWHNELAFLVE